MTVCIAVACDQYNEQRTPKLIMVSDTHVSMGVTSARALKARGLANTWSIMIAGDDVTYAEDVIGEAVALMDARHIKGLSDAALSTTKAYQNTRKIQIEQQFLSSYNIDLDAFLAKGPDFPTSSKRQSLIDEIEKYDLGCEFLVSGFMPGGKSPYIFQVCNPGRYVPQSLLGYWSIGSGNVNAITYLARRGQFSGLDYETSLYNAIAAKKLAEKAE